MDGAHCASTVQVGWPGRSPNQLRLRLSMNGVIIAIIVAEPGVGTSSMFAPAGPTMLTR